MMMPNHKGVMLFERARDDDIVALNAPCRCLHIYPLTASRKIGREATEEIASFLEERPNLFSSTAVFISPTQLDAMEEEAVQRVSGQPVRRSWMRGGTSSCSTRICYLPPRRSE